jgi:methylaspartate ammonia-lyase
VFFRKNPTKRQNSFQKMAELPRNEVIMKIKKISVRKGLGGYVWTDRAAVRKGAQKEGIFYKGEPVTAGFKAIQVPAEAACIQLILEDGQVAYGDCVAVVYTGGWGRDPFFSVDSHIPIIQGSLGPLLEGYELKDFKKPAKYFDELEINGGRLHTAIRYGVTQAILDAVAKAQGITMAEVIANEYGTTISRDPIPILGQTGEDFYSNTEKMIFLRLPLLPHASIKTLKDFQRLLDDLRWTRKRVMELGGENYKPILHFDLYGTMGWFFNHNIPDMVDYFHKLEKECAPLELLIEAPVEMETQSDQIKIMKKLREALKKEKIKIKIIADEWCNTMEDVKKFVEEGAADMIQIKAPDLGGINNTIEAVLYCKENGILAYLGGSAAETERNAQICAHLALATQPCQILGKPGTGIFEATSIIINEMQRALALINNR